MELMLNLLFFAYLIATVLQFGMVAFARNAMALIYHSFIMNDDTDAETVELVEYQMDVIGHNEIKTRNIIRLTMFGAFVNILLLLFLPAQVLDPVYYTTIGFNAAVIVGIMNVWKYHVENVSITDYYGLTTMVLDMITGQENE